MKILIVEDEPEMLDSIQQFLEEENYTVEKLSPTGSKVQANASRHKAMSYEYIQKLEKQLEEEIEKLLDLAASKDESEKGSDLDIPEELKLRKDRLVKIQEAKRVIEQRASERYQNEKEQYDTKMEQRNQKKEKTGKNSRGKEPWDKKVTVQSQVWKK